MGRKPGIPNGHAKGYDCCYFCEGLGLIYNRPCCACEGTGSEKTRRAHQRLYNHKNKLPVTYNFNTEFDTENYKNFNLNK